MLMNMKRAKAIAIGIALCFLMIHLFIINVFQQCGVTPMVRFNIFSVLFYVVIILVAYKGWLQVYCVGVYLEVAIHMTLAVLFTGWDSGFQVTLIGMNVLAFYGEYVGRTLRLKYVKMLPFAILGMILYLGTYIYINVNPPMYTLPGNAEFWLTLIWGVIVFVITGFVMVMFVLIVDSSDKKLSFQMSHDKLTGLPNRYFVSEYMESIPGNKNGKEYWLAIADIDDFKVINDTYGHNCGDYVLKTLAYIFNNRDGILCCRWGGEEFIFINPITESVNEAYELLESLRKEVQAYEFKYDKFSFHVTLTIGMTVFPPGIDDDAWISDADAKLYKGKQNGKNQVVW